VWKSCKEKLGREQIQGVYRVSPSPTQREGELSDAEGEGRRSVRYKFC